MKSILVMLVIILSIQCSKDSSLVEKPTQVLPTTSNVTVNFKSTNIYLTKNFKIVLVNSKNDSIVSDSNNSFSSVPVGSYKVYAYSNPKKMTMENRELTRFDSHTSSTFISDETNFVFSESSSEIGLNVTSTATEIKLLDTLDGKVSIGSLSQLYTDCFGNQALLSLYVYSCVSTTYTTLRGVPVLPYTKTAVAGVSYMPLCY